MNKRIRSMIDQIFAEMKMTAENLALMRPSPSLRAVSLWRLQHQMQKEGS